MKKTFILFGLIITFLLTCLCAHAGVNRLHTITLEKNSQSYNIILNTDSISKVMRKANSNNDIVLELSGITSDDTVNALYRGTGSIDNLVVENAGLNKLKIYITAPNIKSASIIMQPVSGSESLVGESFPTGKAIWSMFVLAIFGLIIKRAIRRTNEDNNILIKKDIKDREIALYRQYRKNIDEDMPLYSKNVKIKNMQRKIDRKIDERLSVKI